MKIALDVDDVLADLLSVWLEKLWMRHGDAEKPIWTPDDLTQWDFAADLGLTEDQLMDALTDDLYNDVLPHSGALSVVNALRARGHEPVYVSTCYQQTVWPWKVEWLSRYGFMTAKDQAFPVGPWAEFKTKGEVGVRHGIQWLVDDSVKNCKEWQSAGGYALLLTRPHNKNQIFNGKRLRKFEDLLLEVKGMEYQTVHSPVMPASPFVGMPVDRSQEPEIWIDERIIAEAVEVFKQGDVIDVDTSALGGTAGAINGKATIVDVQGDTITLQGIKPGDSGYWPDSKPTNPKDAIGSDKLPLSLWPATATVEGSLAMLEGALKYGRNNFRAIGVRSTIYADAAMRHIAAWLEGEDKAADSGISHLGHALACLAIVVDAREAGKLTDDRNFPGGYREMIERVTPEVKRLKEKYADRNPHHYTINDTEVL